MKKATLSLVAVAAFGLAACDGQQDQHQGVGGAPATEAPATQPAPGTVAPGAPGTPGAPGMTGPGMAPGAPGTMHNDTLGQPGMGTTPGAPGTGTGTAPGAPGGTGRP